MPAVSANDASAILHALTSRDALTIAAITLGVNLVLVVAGRILYRSWGVRFGWTFHLFALCAGVLIGMLASPWDTPESHEIIRHLSAITAVLAAFPLAAIVRRLLAGNIKNGASASSPFAFASGANRGGAPRVLGDVASFLLILIAVFATLQFIYDIKVPGLLAGSGVAAIILGLAMQDLLANIFAGVAIHSQKSFQTGDWLLVDGTHARVIEITWRATRLLTFDEVLIEVPNSHIVRNTITNFEKPTPRHAVRVRIGLHYTVPPLRAVEVLRDATTNVPGVLSDAVPLVLLAEFSDSDIIYELKFFVKDHACAGLVQSAVRIACWYATQRAGMEIPFPQVTINRPSRPMWNAISARETATSMLRAHPIFSFLSAVEIDALVSSSPVLLFCAHDPIVRQGMEGRSMFLLAKGTAEVRLMDETGASAVVAQLSAGDCLGEMSLLTGEPRSATVVATTEVEAVEISKETFATLIKKNPNMLTRLSELLAQRQHANEATRTRAPFQKTDTPLARDSIFRRLHSFFDLGG